MRLRTASVEGRINPQLTSSIAMTQAATPQS
jgi:hypothetical protein